MTIILTCLAIAPAIAQMAGGSVTGRVTDASGANIPNTRIELENLDTGQRLTIVTDESGTYTFNNVPAGRYRLITSGTSATAPSQEITVDVSRPNTINITVPSGPATDALVTTEAVATSIKPASVMDVWNTRYVHYLPRANFVDRNGEAYGAYNLSLLTNITTSSVPGYPGGPAFGGQRPETNLFHVDGIDNRNKLTGAPLVYLSNEGTTEFSLWQNQNLPLFGHTGGAQFNSIMRSGTNQVHGSIYNYLQNRHLNAIERPFRLAGFDEDRKPRYDQNRMGASLGLPIVPSKVFFFGNFEYIPLGFEAPVGGLLTAPTAAGITTLGGLRGVSNTNLGILRTAIGGDSPNTATGFASVGGAAIPVGTVNNVQRHWQNQLLGSGALDFNMSEKDQFRFRYVHNEVDGTFSGNALSAFQAPRWQRSLLASASHYHVFGNAVTNELRLGYNRVDSDQYLGAFGTAPQVFIGQAFNLSLGPQHSPTGIVNTYHVADALGVRLGGHQLKFGFDGRRQNGFRSLAREFAGTYVYSNLERFLLDLPPDVSATRAFGNRLDLGHWSFFGFAHDTWSVRPGVTLDLGVRYQYTKLPNAFRAQGDNAIASVPGLIEFNDPQLQRWNFAPYIGVAVSPWQNRTVIRAGAGMWYDSTYWQPFLMGFAPQATRVATGNLNSNTAGFLSGGGLQDPAAGFRDQISAAQARRTVNSFIGGQEMPYSVQWNFAVQQGIWRNSTIEFKYMGNRGVHQPVWGQLNYAGVTADRNLPVFSTNPGQAQLNALPLTLTALQNPAPNPFALAGFTNPINTIDFGGNTWYHGASVSFNHSFTGGFQMNANYTWSRWEDDATGTPLDIGMPFRTRSWSTFDRRHQANITGMWELAPLFRDRDSILRNVFADFNLSGSYNFGTGTSLTPVTGINSGLNNNAFGTSAIVNPEANGNMRVSQLTPLRNAQGATVAYQLNDPGARFIAGAPGVFTGFNRRGIRFDDIHNVNLAAAKRFNFRERASLEVRGEAFNLFNRQQITGSSLHSIGYGLFSPNFMVPGTIDVNNLGSLDYLPTNTRTVQLALRFTF